MTIYQKHRKLRSDSSAIGKEIPVEKTFLWDDEVWHVPAVYACGKGLVADFFA